MQRNELLKIASYAFESYVEKVADFRNIPFIKSMSSTVSEKTMDLWRSHHNWAMKATGEQAKGYFSKIVDATKNATGENYTALHGVQRILRNTHSIDAPRMLYEPAGGIVTKQASMIAHMYRGTFTKLAADIASKSHVKEKQQSHDEGAKDDSGSKSAPPFKKKQDNQEVAKGQGEQGQERGEGQEEQGNQPQDSNQPAQDPNQANQPPQPGQPNQGNPNQPQAASPRYPVYQSPQQVTPIGQQIRRAEDQGMVYPDGADPSVHGMAELFRQGKQSRNIPGQVGMNQQTTPGLYGLSGTQAQQMNVGQGQPQASQQGQGQPLQPGQPQQQPKPSDQGAQSGDDNSPVGAKSPDKNQGNQSTGGSTQLETDEKGTDEQGRPRDPRQQDDKPKEQGADNQKKDEPGALKKANEMLYNDLEKLSWLEDFVQMGPATSKLTERLLKRSVKKAVVGQLDNTVEPIKPIDISNPAYSPNGNANPVPSVQSVKAPIQSQTPVPMATQPSQAPSPGIVEATAPSLHSFKTPTGY